VEPGNFLPCAACRGLISRISQQIQPLASSGVRWYVDDFGTGYSSISHLRDRPIAGLKLDRSFTCAMRARDTKSLRLAQALVGMAEGLENVEEARLLASQGWLHGQGWLYGKAAPRGWVPLRFGTEPSQPGAAQSSAQQVAKATAGSAAPLMGRPITRWLAPAATAAAGVITRF